MLTLTHTHTYTYMYMYVYMYMYIYSYIHIHTYIYIYVYIYTPIHIHICPYSYPYIHIHTRAHTHSHSFRIRRLPSFHNDWVMSIIQTLAKWKQRVQIQSYAQWVRAQHRLPELLPQNTNKIETETNGTRRSQGVPYLQWAHRHRHWLCGRCIAGPAMFL
jgi:hypothetical protein